MIGDQICYLCCGDFLYYFCFACVFIGWAVAFSWGNLSRSLLCHRCHRRSPCACYIVVSHSKEAKEKYSHDQLVFKCSDASFTWYRLHTPDGQNLPGSSIKSNFTGTTAYRRASIANLVPEMDQLILGTYVFPLLDPQMDKANTLEIRAQVREVYMEMSLSEEFDCLGSVMNQNYKDILLSNREIGHFYEYIPKDVSRDRMPVIIFLHGSLGKFKGYLWVWKRIADLHGIAIVAPTFGTGNWDAPVGEEAIELARQYCTTNPMLDPSKIFLAGLSNGGRGVCIEAQRAPDAYQGIIFISPVMDTEALLTDKFVKTWKNKPILILHGTADNRIPIENIKEAIESIKSEGLTVDNQYYEGQTHFLFFTIRKKVQERIGSWLTLVGGSKMPSKSPSSDKNSQPLSNGDNKSATKEEKKQ